MHMNRTHKLIPLIYRMNWVGPFRIKLKVVWCEDVGSIQTLWVGFVGQSA